MWTFALSINVLVCGLPGCKTNQQPAYLAGKSPFANEASIDRSKLISFAAAKPEKTTPAEEKVITKDKVDTPNSSFRQVGFQTQQQQNKADLIPNQDKQSEDEFAPLQVEDAADERDASQTDTESQGDLELDSDSDDDYEGYQSPQTLSENLLERNDGADLFLDEVLGSVANSYPEIEVAIGEIESAAGKVLASWGEFDRIASAYSISQPLGFYQTYQNGTGLLRPLYSGGAVGLDFRIGDGNFEPWFGERETNEGGEIKAKFAIPLLKDREIDARRAKLLSASAQQREVQADVEARLLQFQRFATEAYWEWVATGKAVLVQRQLLELAKQRVRGIEIRIKAEALAEAARFSNNQFIAKRENDRLKAEQAFIKAAIKLSLFYRDSQQQPLQARLAQVPDEFPGASRLPEAEILQASEIAIQQRPEFAAFRALRQAVCVDAKFARNLMLPKLDVKGFAGQDLGGETSSKGDKTPFELQVGVFAEVPLERRKGLGQLEVARGKIRQIDNKVRFLSDKVRAEVQAAAAALNAAYEQIQQSRLNVENSRKSLEAARTRFDAQAIDLIILNQFESLAADAELSLIEANVKYLISKVIYETAISGQAFSEIGLPEAGVAPVLVPNVPMPVDALPPQ